MACDEGDQEEYREPRYEAVKGSEAIDAPTLPAVRLAGCLERNSLSLTLPGRARVVMLAVVQTLPRV